MISNSFKCKLQLPTFIQKINQQKNNSILLKRNLGLLNDFDMKQSRGYRKGIFHWNHCFNEQKSNKQCLKILNRICCSHNFLFYYHIFLKPIFSVSTSTQNQNVEDFLESGVTTKVMKGLLTDFGRVQFSNSEEVYRVMLHLVSYLYIFKITVKWDYFEKWSYSERYLKTLSSPPECVWWYFQSSSTFQSSPMLR